MPARPKSHATNRLLSSLADAERERLTSLGETVDLTIGEVLTNPGEPLQYVYFPFDSIISLVMPLGAGANLEVGIIGSEGMLGITLTLEVDLAPFHSVVQGAGPTLRIGAAAFIKELEQSPPLQRALKRYLYVSLRQLGITAACNRFHLVEARLARWLLLTQDRSHSDNFHVTHVFLAYMLGVRRVGITKAADALRQRKLISYRRGAMTILDRAGLEAASCGCYQAGEAAYAQVLG